MIIFFSRSSKKTHLDVLLFLLISVQDFQKLLVLVRLPLETILKKRRYFQCIGSRLVVHKLELRSTELNKPNERDPDEKM